MSNDLKIFKQYTTVCPIKEDHIVKKTIKIAI